MHNLCVEDKQKMTVLGSSPEKKESGGGGSGRVFSLCLRLRKREKKRKTGWEVFVASLGVNLWRSESVKGVVSLNVWFA